MKSKRLNSVFRLKSGIPGGIGRFPSGRGRADASRARGSDDSWSIGSSTCPDIWDGPVAEVVWNPGWIRMNSYPTSRVAGSGPATCRCPNLCWEGRATGRGGWHGDLGGKLFPPPFRMAEISLPYAQRTQVPGAGYPRDCIHGGDARA